MKRIVLAAMVVATAACGGGSGPASLGSGEPCGYCRMTIGDQALAGQVVGPGEEPRFFDDIGCLSAYLKAQGDAPESQAVYVADHRTKEWVPLRQATITRVDGLPTPMDSHLIAHRDAASRDADPIAKGGAPVQVSELMKAHVPKAGL